MKNIRLALVLSATALLGACASTHPGNFGKVVADENGNMGDPMPIRISAERQKDFSDDYYSFFTFTFENGSGHMLRIKTTEIEFSDSVTDRANVLVGDDLVAWAQGWEEGEKKRQQNAKVAQMAMMIGGLVATGVGRATHNSTLTLVGGASVAGGAGWSLGSAISKSVNDAHNPKKVPQEHVYASFAIPAKMFVRKWAVVERSRKLKIHRIYLTVTFENDEERRYAFDIR